MVKTILSFFFFWTRSVQTGPARETGSTKSRKERKEGRKKEREDEEEREEEREEELVMMFPERRKRLLG